MTTPKTYEERLQEGALFSLSYYTSQYSRDSELYVDGCCFGSLNRDDNDSKFMVIERDDMKGFNVFMKNVTVVPSSSICIGDAPMWLQWLIGKVCRRIVWPYKPSEGVGK